MDDAIHAKSCYYTKDDISKVVEILSREKLQLAAHNALFDWTHLFYHFQKPLNFKWDSGVVSQCINNSYAIHSFGLKQTTERLYNVVTQEKEIQEYLKVNHKIAGSQYGSYIHLCPEEMIEKYCRLDAEYCLRIINDRNKWLKSDISQYMMIYMNEVKMTIQQFIEGILVDREGLKKVYEGIKNEVDGIKEKFLTEPKLVDFIYNVQVDKFNKAQSKLKKKQLIFEEWSELEENKFNVDSTDQLKQLFDSQKLHFDEKTQKFKYPYVNPYPMSKVPNPDSPKLGAKYLHAYGIGGQILSDRGEKITFSHT